MYEVVHEPLALLFRQLVPVESPLGTGLPQSCLRTLHAFFAPANGVLSKCHQSDPPALHGQLRYQLQHLFVSQFKTWHCPSSPPYSSIPIRRVTRRNGGQQGLTLTAKAASRTAGAAMAPGKFLPGEIKGHGYAPW